MHSRLLSFLTDFENALLADDPSPSDGSWETARTINYHLGLARLALSVKPATGETESRGSVLLQSYQLADGTPCLKAALSWAKVEGNIVRAIYAKPDVNWKSEARKVAAEWMAGAPASLTAAASTGAPVAAVPLATEAAPLSADVAATG